MRPTMRPEGMLERLALQFNLGPIPVVEAMFGMATSRVVMAGVRLGVYAALAEQPGNADTVAQRCGLAVDGARHLLDCLAALEHVQRDGDRYSLFRRARKWLAPDLPTYVGDFLEFNYDQWEWWSHLEEIVRTGQGHEIHAYGPDDPRWRRYIIAMFQLARLSAPEVARKLRLPPNPRRLLDLAGGHGWFAAELCRRHPALQATVLDLPGSARIGREIVAEAGLSERVCHVEGDMFSTDLGGPYDGVLCFQIVHHLSPEQNVALFKRVYDSLAPGGTLAVLDYFTPPPQRKPDSAAFLGLHFYLTSSAATYAPSDLAEWLREAGFQSPCRLSLRRIPVQSLFEARKPC